MPLPDAPLAVLLLAWDDADPAPGVLGAALPPGAPLRAALAAQLRLTAILPQRPPAEEPHTAGVPAAPAASHPVPAAGPATPAVVSVPAAAGPAAVELGQLSLNGVEQVAASGEEPANSPPLSPGFLASPAPVSPTPTPGNSPRQPATDAATALPPLSGATSTTIPPVGPAAAAAYPVAAPGAPVLIGLADWTLAELSAEARRRGSPAGLGRAAAGAWQVPAAPYVGRATAATGPTPPAPANPAAPPALPATAPAPAPAPTAPEPTGLPQPSGASALAGALPPSSPPGPALSPPASANEAVEPVTTENSGPPAGTSLGAAADSGAELSSLAHQQLAGARPAALAALRRPAVLATVLAAVLAAGAAPGAGGGAPAAGATGPLAELVPAATEAAVEAAAAALSFRLIQYARFATQLTAGGADFALILAVAWPTWLAAAEIRQRTGRPLVLLVSELPSARAPRRARGWLRGVERQALLRADLILVPTADVARQLGEQYALRRAPQVLAELRPMADGPGDAADLAFANQRVADTLLAQLQTVATGRA